MPNRQAQSRLPAPAVARDNRRCRRVSARCHCPKPQKAGPVYCASAERLPGLNTQSPNRREATLPIAQYRLKLRRHLSTSPCSEGLEHFSVRRFPSFSTVSLTDEKSRERTFWKVG